MGFCYPGKGTNGDIAPRPECAPLWHHQLLKPMTNVKPLILIGQYAHQYYLGSKLKTTLTATVKNYTDYLLKYLPLVHPSPRNRIWQKKNPWFETEIVPALQFILRTII
jgi:uracil-DNA glycosylase